ncbi:cell division inhibitor [Vibrio maritimus]|uniref:Cell division inhibitor n=1 Tax=Vibrio maritimus TaxID=990268 RepID=A0A090TX96_9VIBR|nr:cell division inhibitor [Vibrio maritimus]
MPTSLTLFYDGHCPLCVKEMTALKKHDTDNVIQLVDIFSETFEDYPDIDQKAASERLHAYDENGVLWEGLDVTYQAWRLVGRGHYYAFTRWPLLRPICDWCYLKFARHRYTVSGLLTGKKRCDNCRID